MRALAAGILVFLSQNAWACGHCVEDKIAAVYDHGAVSRAVDAGHTVVFFGIDGALKPGQPARLRIEKSAASVAGVDAGSVRLSVELASLALAFDPKRTRLVEVQKALEARLKALGLSLFVIRTMDRPGDLAEARQLH